MCFQAFSIRPLQTWKQRFLLTDVGPRLVSSIWRDFGRNLSICLSFAYRKGVRDEVKDQAKAENHVDQEGQRDKGLAKNRDREGEAQNSPNIVYENNHLQRNLAKVDGA